MVELIFDKCADDEEYSVGMDVLSSQKDSVSMSLDTGSPITTICIQNLIKISNESRVTLLNKISDAISYGNYIEFGVYGSQDHNIRRRFVPYLLNDVTIGGCEIKFFLMWIDVTNYKKLSAITSTLFGFDYIKQGKKWFDENDNFHIQVKDSFDIDLRDAGGALNHYSNRLLSLKELIDLNIVKAELKTAKNDNIK